MNKRAAARWIDGRNRGRIICTRPRLSVCAAWESPKSKSVVKAIRRGISAQPPRAFGGATCRAIALLRGAVSRCSCIGCRICSERASRAISAIFSDCFRWCLLSGRAQGLPCCALKNSALCAISREAVATLFGPGATRAHRVRAESSPALLPNHSVIRDISSPDIVAGNRHSNLRELVQRKLRARD